MGPRMKDITFVLLAFLLCICLSSCKKREEVRHAPVHEVSVLRIVPRELVLTTELPGRVNPFRIAEIRPQVSGILVRRLFKEGDYVREGEVLYQIDDRSYTEAVSNAEAAIKRTLANLEAVKAKYERYVDLVKVGAVSKQEFDDVSAQYKQLQAEIEYLKAQLEMAKINLEYTKIKAPISGKTGKSYVTEGALVTAHQPQALTVIQQIDPVYVDITQSVNELAKLRERLKEGRLKYAGKDQEKVKILTEDGKTLPHEGTIQFKDITVDPTTGSVNIRVLVPNPEGTLLPGMFVRAVIKEGVNRKAILVPQSAVFRDTKANPFVYLVDNENRVRIRSISVDRSIRDKWLVSQGLSEGDRVIVEGMQRIRPGDLVKPLPYKGD